METIKMNDLYQKARKTLLFQDLVVSNDKIAEINRKAEIYNKKLQTLSDEAEKAYDLHPLPTYDEVETLTREELDEKYESHRHFSDNYHALFELESAVFFYRFCRRRSQKKQLRLLRAIERVIELGFEDIFYNYL